MSEKAISLDHAQTLYNDLRQRSENLKGSFAKEYDPTIPHEAGELCTHDSRLYSCISDIETPEAWTAAHWKEETLAGVANELALAIAMASGYVELEIVNGHLIYRRTDA